MPWRTGIVHLVGSRQCHATGEARIAVGNGFVCHAQQRADRKQLRTQVNELRYSEGVSNVEGYSIPDVWSMNRWRCRRAPEMCSDAAGLDAAAA